MIETNVSQKVSWQEIENLCEQISIRVKESGRVFENIYPIQRGGLIPATILSHKLGLPIETDKKEISLYTLVVDDISDSGKTLKQFDTLHTVCLHERFDTETKPWISGQTLLDKTWLIYPWESEQDEKIQDYRKSKTFS